MDDKEELVYTLLDDLDMERAADFILDELIKVCTDEQIESFVENFRQEHVKD